MEKKTITKDSLRKFVRKLDNSYEDVIWIKDVLKEGKAEYAVQQEPIDKIIEHLIHTRDVLAQTMLLIEGCITVGLEAQKAEHDAEYERLVSEGIIERVEEEEDDLDE